MTGKKQQAASWEIFGVFVSKKRDIKKESCINGEWFGTIKCTYTCQSCQRNRSIHFWPPFRILITLNWAQSTSSEMSYDLRSFLRRFAKSRYTCRHRKLIEIYSRENQSVFLSQTGIPEMLQPYFGDKAIQYQFLYAKLFAKFFTESQTLPLNKRLNILEPPFLLIPWSQFGWKDLQQSPSPIANSNWFEVNRCLSNDQIRVDLDPLQLLER